MCIFPHICLAALTQTETQQEDRQNRRNPNNGLLKGMPQLCFMENRLRKIPNTPGSPTAPERGNQMTIMSLLFSLFIGIGYHPVLVLHNPQPVMPIGIVRRSS
jgi:hypothetical protein